MREEEMKKKRIGNEEFQYTVLRNLSNTHKNRIFKRKSQISNSFLLVVKD